MDVIFVYQTVGKKGVPRSKRGWSIYIDRGLKKIESVLNTVTKFWVT